MNSLNNERRHKGEELLTEYKLAATAHEKPVYNLSIFDFNFCILYIYKDIDICYVCKKGIRRTKSKMYITIALRFAVKRNQILQFQNFSLFFWFFG